MYVRLGFVAMSLELENASPSKTTTIKHLAKIGNHADRVSRLYHIARENLQNCLRILRHCVAHDIRVYRFTSKLIPLATHPDFSDWNYIDDLRSELTAIGNFIKENKMRISAHPDHYTILNSPHPEVLEGSIRNLDYHINIFRGIGLGKEAKLVLHLGGLYNNKENSIARFQVNFSNLPDYMKDFIVLENDDKIFTAKDVLKVCQLLDCPMVLDVHHFSCNNRGESLEDLWPAIYETWAAQKPKIHFSSPRSARSCRSHADDIAVEDFLAFLEIAKKYDCDLDIMLEAKNKDVALFNLMNELKKIPKIEIVDGASFNI